MKSLSLLFVLLGLSSCILKTEDEVQYVYDLKIQSENKDVTIDSVEVKVSANNSIILEKIYPKPEIKDNVVTIIFNAKQTDKINLSYAAYSKDFKVLEDSEEFELGEAQKNSDRVNIVKLDSLLIIKISSEEKDPEFKTDNSDFPDTLTVGFESKIPIDYENYAAENLKLELSGLKEVSLKEDTLLLLASEEILGLHNIEIKLLDSNGNAFDSLLWELVILDTNHSPMFVTKPSDIASTLRTNTEIRDSLYYEDADGDSAIWAILEGPAWLSLKNGILDFNAEDNDTGTVNVLIEIQDGKGKSDSLNFSLEIIKQLGSAPAILDQPQGDSIASGRDIQLSITAFGENLAYQWQKNGLDLTGENAATLWLEKISVSDSGSFYRCIVSNEGGADTSSGALLEVFVFPKILSSPASLSLMPGESRLLFVNAEGSGLSFQWLKNGIDILGANSDSLNVGPVDLSNDADTYICIISNFLGSDTSQTALLSVASYNQFTDSRDGKMYNTISIGTQEWMAENLNYDNPGQDSWCYSDNGNNCDVYGRLYTWDLAVSTQNLNGKDICPEDWHLPSGSEWEDLFNYVSAQGYAGREGEALKSSSGWNNNQNGDNIFSFNALPAGYRLNTGEFTGLNVESGYWTNQAQNGVRSYYYSLNSAGPQFVQSSARKSDAFSIRCLKD